MPVSIFFNDAAGREQALVLDAVPQETHAGEVEATEHPVERGASPADHLRPKPETLTIQGMVGDAPLFWRARGLGVSSFKSGRTEDAYAKLLALKDGGQLCAVLTDVRRYENVALVSLSRTRTAKTGGALDFSATFRAIRVVESQTITVKPLQKKSGGKQVPTPADAPTAEKGRQSAAAWLFDLATGD